MGHHGNTYEIDKSKPVVVGKDSIPEPNNIIYVKFLAKQQHQPTQTVILRIETSLLKMLMQLRINSKHQEVKLLDFPIDAGVFGVHGTHETIPDF